MPNDLDLNLLLQQKLQKYQYDIPSDIQQKLSEYLQLLIKWNQTYNLTRITDPNEMITKHILDSLSIQKYLHGKNILDVGTGAGLPGIPLALIEPEREFVLLDSNRKKTIFLTQVIAELKIPNVKIVCDRVEKFKPNYCFDTIMSRAFSSLKEFVELTQHLCCADGQFLAMKGEYPEEEIKMLGEEYSSMVYDLQVPGLDAQRHLVIITRP